MAAIGQATKHGVIIKSGEALEKMGKVTTIAFDKTGTLTYGKLEVSDIISLEENISESKLLALTASAEMNNIFCRAGWNYASESRSITGRKSEVYF